jgi:hypothetical protein
MRLTIQNNGPRSQGAHTSGDYLNVAFGWLHRLLAWQIAVTRATFGVLADDDYRGLYVANDEVDLFCDGYPEIPSALVQQRADLAAERMALAQEFQAAARDGNDLPLCRVVRHFGLTPFAVDLLLLALAPEVDLRYERIFAFIQDDVSKKRPSVDLALRLLCVTPDERRAARTAFAPDAPLLRHQLIRFIEDEQRQPPLPGRFIKLDERIVMELLDEQPVCVDPRLLPYVTVSEPTRTFDDLVLPAGLVAQLRRFVPPSGNPTIGTQASNNGKPPQHPAHAVQRQALVVGLQGSYGSGRQAIAEALCAGAHLPLLSVSLDRMVTDTTRADTLPLPDPDEALRLVLREATLRQAAIFWQGADQVLHDTEQHNWRRALLEALDAHAGLTFLALDRPWEARGHLQRNRFLRVPLPELSYSEREQIWRQQFAGADPDAAPLQALASTFRLSGGQIRDAVIMAHTLAHWNDDRPALPALPATGELYAACRAQSTGRLDHLAHKVNATYDWDDIVLPADQVRMLREICVQVRHRRTVLDGWGFDRHLAMGKGVNVLFAGQSGTGKTMAAEIIAADLGLELYKVDLSALVSKYIGETEKNLEQIFTAAHEANAILFFDEADALFGKRSEVKDSHDRYANIEVGYLLQKMEAYDGVVILATNMRKNLDDAFVRRLHVAIDFPFPEEPDRRRIWHKVFPAAAPLADDVDLDFLAKQFKLAGATFATSPCCPPTWPPRMAPSSACHSLCGRSGASIRSWASW